MERDGTRQPVETRQFGATFLIPLLLAGILNPINSSMLATALTPIGHDFSEDPTATAWLVASLYLSAAVAQPLFGGVADMIGAKRSLVIGLVVVAIGGVVGALAPTLMTLILSRILIGIGTSAGFPCAMRAIRDRAAQLEVEPPVRILGYLSMTSAAATALGPPGGGLIIAALGWRWIFLVNLPLSCIALVAVLALLPKDPPRRPSDSSLDLPGMILFSASVTFLMLFLMRLGTRVDLISLMVGMVMLVALAVVELRTRLPFIDVRMAATNPGLAGTYGRHILLNIVSYGLFYSLPQGLQAVQGLSPTLSGMVLVPVAVCSAFAALAPTRERKGLAVQLFGSIALIAACATLLSLDSEMHFAMLMLMGASFGLGFGILNMANQQSLLDHAEASQAGVAAGLLRTAQYTGATLSAALIGLVLGNHPGEGPMHSLALLLFPLSILVAVLMTVARVRDYRRRSSG